jgi:hypothetical protein
MRRRLIFSFLGAAALGLLAGPVAHADVWANVGPASSISGLASRYPLGNYSLDEHFTAISAGVLSGVDVSGLLPMIAYFFANELWQLTAWLANLLVELFAFAFSLDLVNGSGANGAGALGPVSRAIQSIYSDVFGGPWMVLAVSVAGCWAMWKALVQRRYAETAGQLALSLVYVGIAFLFVLQPGRTIGTASHWTNEMSGAFLSIAKDGEPSSQGEAKEAGADQLFGLLVAQPWAVLEFGGLDHCVKAGGGDEPESAAVQPLPDGAARRLEAGEEISVGGKTCVGNLRRYGPHFLRFEPGSGERDDEYEALSHGDSAKLPDADPGKKDGSYELGPVDEPAAAAMEKGGQYQRLLVAIVVFVAELGAFCLLGALSIGVITAQILLLLLLAFSPVALVAAAIPGRGHQFFRGWLSKLAGFLLRKAAYSLVLAVLLAVCAAISELGWLLSFGLQCAFFWAVFLQRKSLTDGLIGAVTGPGVPGRERTLDAVALYMGARTGTRLASRPARAVGTRLGRGRGRDASPGSEATVGSTVMPAATRAQAPPSSPDPPARTAPEETRATGPTSSADPSAGHPARGKVQGRADKDDDHDRLDGRREGEEPQRRGRRGAAGGPDRGEGRSPRRRRPEESGDHAPDTNAGGPKGGGGQRITRRGGAPEADPGPGDRRKEPTPRRERMAPTRPASTAASRQLGRPGRRGLADELDGDAERVESARSKAPEGKGAGGGSQRQADNPDPEARPDRRPGPDDRERPR